MAIWHVPSTPWAQELEKGIDLRKQMMADISHELRTPLTVLASKLEFTLEQNKPLETEDVVVLYDEVIRLKGLVGELQDLSKLEAGHTMLDKTLISFRDYFADFTVLLEAEAESRQMNLVVNLDNAPEYCYADPKRLKQIILNLVNNAFRYTSAGGTITVEARQEGKGFFCFLCRIPVWALHRRIWIKFLSGSTGPTVPVTGKAAAAA